jgi:glycosyltransferase involved in cell wall biosynthesis
VIVLAFNAASTIRTCLTSLELQDFEEPFEIVVVWSGDSATARIVQQEFPKVKLVGQHSTLPTGAGRNLGIEHALGEIIAFLAADCQAEPDWLRRRVTAHRQGFDCVGGAVVNGERYPVARASHLLEYSEFMIGRPREVVVGRPVYTLSFVRNVFERYGTYEPGLACGEDSLFNWRLVKAGERFLFDPSIRITHPGPIRLRDFLKHQQWHGEWLARLCRDHNHPAIHGHGAQLFWKIILVYPSVRLIRLVQRIVRWRPDLLGELVYLSPFLFLGVSAATFGVARGWWGSRWK